MARTHIAFIVESAHGHINPILGITSELVRRGHRVTCAVKDYFAPRVADSGAEPLVYEPLDYRTRFIPSIEQYNRWNDKALIMERWNEFEQEEIEDALPQLELLYREKRPDLIIYDLRNLAGRSLACKWGLPKIEHAPMMIESNECNQLERPYDEDLIIVSVPRFFQPDVERLDGRFHFVGPIYTNRGFFQPWKPSPSPEPLVLVSATTALPQIEFYKLVICALEIVPCRVVLSIGNVIPQEALDTLPGHFELNHSSSQMDILDQASLYIGQGGQGSTLEAIYCGVPLLLIPPGKLFEQVAHRVAQLGLGMYIDEAAASVEEVRRLTLFLLGDDGTRRRVKEAQKTMSETPGAKLSADLILKHLSAQLP